MSYGRGDPVEFEFNSENASVAAPLVLRESGGRETRTLAADERFVLEQVSAHVVQTDTASTNITARIIADTNESGNLVVGDMMAVLGGGPNHASFAPNGMAGALGVIPKVLASGAGQIYIAGSGYIQKG